MQNIINENARQALNRPITGVIQNDRIWEQWYDQAIFTKDFPKCSQKDYLFSCIGDEPDRVIINNRGMKKFTVAEFKAMVWEFEKAFAAMKLQKGDIVCTVSLTTPEMYAIKYSATSLGLITCNLNVLDMGITDENGKKRLFNQMANVEPKMIFTLDVLEDKVYSVINDKEFDKATKVILPLERSTSAFNPERAALGLKNLSNKLSGKKIENSISLNKFLSYGKPVKDSEVVEIYEEGLPCNISFTSGTTGVNKAVLLSHDANNALAYQQKIGGFTYKSGTTNLALVPPFLAFWDSTIVHSLLSLGVVEIIELFLEYDKIPAYFKKHKPTMGAWSQYLWSSILTLPDNHLKEISKKLTHPIVGGERCEINEAERFFEKTGIRQMTGFGASEVNTTFSITHSHCSKTGTSGIPLPFNNIKIVDDNGNDVTYNVPGKLYITGPCLMNGYFKRDDLTEKALHKDENGLYWYYTGDYAVMDNDGCLTVLDRYMPPVEIETENGTEKVNLLDIIEKIKQNRNIKHCKMTNNNGKLILHFSIYGFTNLTEKEAVDSVIDTIKTSLPEKHYPHIICVYNDLPRTSVGKVDYKSLQALGDELSEANDNCKKLTVVYQEK